MKLNKTIIVAMLALCMVWSGNAQVDKATDSLNKANQFNYLQGVELMGAVMGNLAHNYVDTVSIQRLSRIGIDAMLSGLDPYTEFFSREQNDEFKLMTKGEYAGIGSIISQRPDSTVIINSPMEGQPAANAGLKAGDIILEIDGKDYRKATSPVVSVALKGIPGTTIAIKVHRPGEKGDRVFKFKRAKIKVNPVTYYTALPNKVGYIYFSTFSTDNAAEKFEAAFRDLKDNHGITSLIIDLRNNGGGLVSEAVKIINLFVPKGEEVLSIKGREEMNATQKYYTEKEPLDSKIPLTVLINSSSASASEIVAGALQDLDRAVVLGTKSYGKGLVQRTVELPYGSMLKLTTGHYYIPSGRCIQKIDYSKLRAGQLAVVPDSLTRNFTTAGGREVHDAGGILPDIEVAQDSLPTMLFYMDINPDVFDYVTRYANSHKTIASPEEFSITDADYADFEKYLKEKKFDYDRQSGKVLEQLEKVASAEGYKDRVQGTLDELKKQLTPDLARDMKTFKKEVTTFLNNEIVSRFYYEKGKVRVMLKEDKVVKKAQEVLLDPAAYKKILTETAITGKTKEEAKK